MIIFIKSLHLVNTAEVLCSFKNANNVLLKIEDILRIFCIHYLLFVRHCDNWSGISIPNLEHGTVNASIFLPKALTLKLSAAACNGVMSLTQNAVVVLF